MASNNSSPSIIIISLSDFSKSLLKAQTLSNILWVSMAICGLVVISLQLITTAFWKRLRKIDYSMITAIAIGDLLKNGFFLTLAIRRLTEMTQNMDDVSSQFRCMVWLCFNVTFRNTVMSLIALMSLDRLTALSIPIWYKKKKHGLKPHFIAFSCVLGVATAGGLFVGASDSPVVACSYGVSQTPGYLVFGKWFDNSISVVILVLNLLSCLVLVIRWRQAVRANQDMKSFKKNIQFNALKMLLAVSVVFLLTSMFVSFWSVLMPLFGWDQSQMISYGPIAALCEMARGVIDFPIYVIMVRDYREGFMQVCCRYRCVRHGANGVAPTGASVSGVGTTRTVTVKASNTPL